MRLIYFLVLATAEALKCQVCKEMHDSVGNRIDESQQGCFNGTIDYLTECPRYDDVKFPRSSKVIYLVIRNVMVILVKFNLISVTLDLNNVSPQG